MRKLCSDGHEYELVWNNGTPSVNCYYHGEYECTYTIERFMNTKVNWVMPIVKDARDYIQGLLNQ